MPRAPNPNIKQAEKMFLEGCKLIDIAKTLSIPEGTIRRWKSTYKWGNDSERSHKNKPNVRKKVGAPKNNKNAVGHGAPKGNKNNLKHGAYSKQKELSDDELELIDFANGKTPYELMEDEYKDLVIKEYRLTKAIEDEKENVKGLSIKDITTRKLVIDNKKQDETTTHVSSTFERIMRLEAELTKVRNQKIKCINNLHKMKMDTKWMQVETATFEYQKQKDEIEIEIKLARLELDKSKNQPNDEVKGEDDGFLKALSTEGGNVWED